MSDGTLRMREERTRLVESFATICPRCMVPWSDYGCTHSVPTPEKLLATVWRIAAEEAEKQRRRNAEHALRYRAEAAKAISAREEGERRRMSDRLASLEETARHDARLHKFLAEFRPSDVLALVEVAKAARGFHHDYESQEKWAALGAALSALDGEEGKA